MVYVVAEFTEGEEDPTDKAIGSEAWTIDIEDPLIRKVAEQA